MHLLSLIARKAIILSHTNYAPLISAALPSVLTLPHMRKSSAPAATGHVERVSAPDDCLIFALRGGALLSPTQ